MGHLLTKPFSEMVSTDGWNDAVRFGCSCMQGWKEAMEDCNTCLSETTNFFAVYDGHGGDVVSKYAANNLHQMLFESENFAAGKFKEAIEEAFVKTDQKLRTVTPNQCAGSTAVIALIKDEKIYCGNVGDCRATMSIRGVAKPLTIDHMATNPTEINRIEAAGGSVKFNRVNGNMAASRALGDFYFKDSEKDPCDQIISVFPEVAVHEINKDDEFLVLATDGIWKAMDNQEVVDFCRERLADGIEPKLVCEQLLSKCLAPDTQAGGKGCDNMTIILVCMLQGKSWDSFLTKCQQPKDEEVA